MHDLSIYNSFEEVLKLYENFDFEAYLKNVKKEDILESLEKRVLDEYDLLNLLSKQSNEFLESMAKISKEHKLRHFGKEIQLYIPIYISNYCSSDCSYCGFSKKNKIKRKHLSLEEIEQEAKEISKTGIKHILLLTGEARNIANLNYLQDAVSILKNYFSSISIEVYPLDEKEYKVLEQSGVDSLTLYQEVYDKEVYKEVHTSGEKTDYKYRLDAVQRGAKANFRAVNIGVLFGLAQIEKEAFFSALHAKYLMQKYPDLEVSLSLPRINNSAGNFKAKYEIDDFTYVKIMLIYRIFLPNIGINVSTREKASFRDNLIDIGATKFSAGSKTDVGGYSMEDKSTAQFEISDEREVEEIVKMIENKGYQAVFKDWQSLY